MLLTPHSRHVGNTPTCALIALEILCGLFTCIMHFMGSSILTVILFRHFVLLDPTSCNFKLKLLSCCTLSGDVKIYQGLSPILGVQAKQVTCIVGLVFLVTVGLVSYKYLAKSSL